MSDNLYHRCVELYRAGSYPQEIIQITGLPARPVLNAIARARVRGDILRHHNQNKKPLRYYADTANIKLGYIGDIGDELSSEQRKWLVDEVVRLGCGSVAEYLAEIVRDLHAEAVLPHTPSAAHSPEPGH